MRIIYIFVKQIHDEGRKREFAAPSIKVLSLEALYVITALLSASIVLDRPIATSVIPIRHVPSAPPVYTLPRHASTSQLEQKRPASPKKNRRFSFMPGKKDTSQAFVRSPLRHSLRELSSHKKEQSGSLPDFTQFTPGKNKNKNKNFNNNNNNSKHNETNLFLTARVPVTTQHPELNSSGTAQDDGNDDLMHTQSETSLTASSNVSLGDGNFEQMLVVHRRSSSTDNLRTEAEKQRPALRDSVEVSQHKHFLARGLCLGSYPLFHKGNK